MGVGIEKRRSRHKATFIYFSELEMIFDELGITKKRFEFCGVSQVQYYNWKKKGKVPAEKFWAFQREMCVFFDKESLRKKAILRIIDKEFLEKLIEEIDEI